MGESYTINAGNHTVRVSGKLQDSEAITVTVNGEERTVKRNGSIKDTAASFKVTNNAGITVKETPGTQKLRFPDGLRIKKTAATKKATLPDGTKLKVAPGTTKVTPPDGSGMDASQGTGSDAFESMGGVNATIDGETNISITTESQSSSVSVTSSGGSSSISITNSSTTHAEYTASTSADTTKTVFSKLRPGVLLIVFTIIGAVIQSYVMLGIAVTWYTGVHLAPVLMTVYQDYTDTDADTDSEPVEAEDADAELREQFDFLPDAQRDDAVRFYKQYKAGDIDHETFEQRLDGLLSSPESQADTGTVAGDAVASGEVEPDRETS